MREREGGRDGDDDDEAPHADNAFSRATRKWPNPESDIIRRIGRRRRRQEDEGDRVQRESPETRGRLLGCVNWTQPRNKIRITQPMTYLVELHLPENVEDKMAGREGDFVIGRCILGNGSAAAEAPKLISYAPRAMPQEQEGTRTPQVLSWGN